MEEIRKGLMEAVKQELGEGYEVQIDAVTKNNGVISYAIVIGKVGQNVHMTVYIDHIADMLCKGSMKMSDAARDVIREYKGNECKVTDIGTVVVGFTKQGILDNVVYQLVNANKNAKQFSDIPYKLFLDLTVIYRVVVGENVLDFTSFIINHKVCEIYDIGEEELNEAAKRNTAKRGFAVRLLAQVIEDAGSAEEEFRDDCQLYILTSSNYLYGATVMLYPDYFSGLANKLGGDLYILPSSVHEVLTITVNGMDLTALREMVDEVNRNMVSEEEFLSGNVYRYSKEKGKIEIAS